MTPSYSASTEAEALELRPATTQDLPRLAAAFAKAFGRGRALDVWKSIYCQSPDGSISHVACDAASSSIVAHYGGTLHPAQGPDYPNGLIVVQTRDAFSDRGVRSHKTGRKSVFGQTAEGFFGDVAEENRRDGQQHQVYSLSEKSIGHGSLPV